MKDIIRTIIALSLLACFASCTSNSKEPKDRVLEGKIEKLLSQMTLEEKIGQMNQITSSGNIEEMSTSIKKGEIGSILNEVSASRVNALQRVAVEESRHGIPLLIARDVIHGFKTIFPIPLGQAATFNPEIVKQGARISAIEASSVGVKWTFSPMIDIARDPRWGRIAEGYGEDTYLTTVMGIAAIEGYQGDSLGNSTSLASCPKHFVGYGAGEGGRDYNSTFIPERQLRNVYLPPFEAAVKAGAVTFMTSFNDNDGVPSTGNAFILKDVLRGEWGFDGIVVSDWASGAEMIPHGFAANGKEVAMKSVNAGVDLEMVSNTYMENLQQLIKEGKIKQAIIDDAVRNILRVKFRLGLFDNPYVDEDLESPMYLPEHLEAAKQTATQAVILLKNEKQLLPLGKHIKSMAVIGPMADAPYDQLGTWVFDGDKTYTQTPLMALREQYGDRLNIIYEKGLEYSRDKSKAGIAKAVSAAARADVALLFVGEEAILSGEAHCLADLDLQGAQSELIEAVSKTGKPIVLIVMAGRPLTIGKEVDLSQSVLFSFHPGTMGGPAIADLLFGVESPSGKTPVTFLKTVGQVPMYYAHTNTGRPPLGSEVLIDDIPLEAGQTSLGNTSFYLDAGLYPLYPFGYGLSYTTFNYDNISLSSTDLKANESLTISFELSNTGSYKGTEVAQLYIQDKFGSITRPVKELKRFKRITLEPGEKQTVSFELPVSELAFWNIDMQKVVEPGEFALWVAGDSQSGEAVSFVVSE